METVPQSVYDICLYTKKPREGAVTPSASPGSASVLTWFICQKSCNCLSKNFNDKVHWQSCKYDVNICRTSLAGTYIPSQLCLKRVDFPYFQLVLCDKMVLFFWCTSSHSIFDVSQIRNGIFVDRTVTKSFTIKLQPHNSLHLGPDERKYYVAGAQKHASGTIERSVQQPQRLCLEDGVHGIQCYGKKVTKKQPRTWIQSTTFLTKHEVQNVQCKKH